MMLPNCQQAYQKLELLFQQLQIKIANETTTSANLKSDLLEIQQLQQQVVALQLEQTDQEVIDFQSQIQPIQTEVTKQLRLLETDLLFLQTARQPATGQQHRQRISNRLTLLLRYCAAILALK